MSGVSLACIENYFKHQARVVTRCLRGILLPSDDLTYREIDCMGKDERDKLHAHDIGALLEDVKRGRNGVLSMSGRSGLI